MICPEIPTLRQQNKKERIVKAVILAGGFGTRLSEETVVKPKPMVEIGERPILWHILKIYSHYGINDFIICLGYKGYIIKEYFANYFLHMSDVTIDLSNRSELQVHQNNCEPWRITLVDTGQESMTGGRLRRIGKYVQDGDFCMTYGDGLANVDIAALIAFHQQEKRLATVTAVQPPGRFGALEIKGTEISAFAEKPKGDGGWINGGFFVLSPQVLEYIDGDHIPFEAQPMANLARDGQLSAYRHTGFWQAMDTLRDKNTLDELWNTGQAKWRIW